HSLLVTQPTGYTEQRGWEAEPPGGRDEIVAMASAALELMGFFLGLLGLLGTTVAT
ncbi:hypothetical protein KUCAC02_035387, partial [Chaenocephalus aceratus]